MAKNISRRDFLRLSSIVSAGLLFRPSFSDAESIEDLLPESNRPLVEVYNVMVNTSGDYRYVIRKDEKAGVKDQICLAKTSFYEDQWIHLPKKEIWVEIGTNEKIKNRVLVLSTRDIDYSIKLIRENDTMIHYHIHPRLTLHIETALNHCKDAYAKACMEQFLEHPILDARPTFADFKFVLSDTLLFKNIRSEGTLSHKICSRFGITEYGATEAGVHRYLYRGEVPIIYNDLVKNPEKDSLALINRVCDEITNDYLYARFTPHINVPKSGSCQHFF